MTSTNIKSDRTEMRHCKQKKLQEGKGESQRDEIFELVKEIVSVERRKGKGVGVHCERQIVGAHVVEVAQVPGALLFHGSHRLSVKTAQPCRQLCSGGCGGERRGPLFSISLLISISVLISLPARRISIPSKFLSHVCSLHLQKYHKGNKSFGFAFKSLDNIYMSVCSSVCCFGFSYCCDSSQTA